MTSKEHPGKRFASRSGRGVKATRCDLCHAPILTGIDADVCAFTARVDVTPLDPMGEVVAVVGGRHTYTLNRRGSTAILTRRNSSAITRQPAGGHNILTPYDVLPEHACGQPLPAHPSQLDNQAAAVVDGPPPF